ncbi:hypothetical protein [Mycolicibacterium sp. HS_4_1]
MTTGRRAHRRATDWDKLIPEAYAENAVDDYDLVEIVDLDDQFRAFHYSAYGAEVGHDGDDDSKLVRVRSSRVGTGDQDEAFDADKIDPTKRHTYDQVQVKSEPVDSVAGQIVSDGHGFLVVDKRSRPWKTAPRTNCAHCAGEMPAPDVTRFKCEFEPDDMKGCKCSGCTLRDQVARGHERNTGQPKKYCTPECRRLADNERNRWKRAVAKAEKLGIDPPAEPEDKGLKLVQHNGLRSSVEGTGHRYVASTASGLPEGVPRA